MRRLGRLGVLHDDQFVLVLLQAVGHQTLVARNIDHSTLHKQVLLNNGDKVQDLVSLRDLTSGIRIVTQ
jgi:hypothetical protein